MIALFLNYFLLLSCYADVLHGHVHSFCDCVIESIFCGLSHRDISQIPGSSTPPLDSTRLAECEFYLRTYGGHLTTVDFYRRHEFWQKAAKYILSKKV